MCLWWPVTERFCLMLAPESPKILVLGGTAEAAAIAQVIVSRWGKSVRVTTSLAGRTLAPLTLPGAVRIGGFGGAAAMADYLRDEEVAVVIDATHPFAAQISENARTACLQAAVPRLLFDRPPWQQGDEDQWHMVENSAQAAAQLAEFGSKAFLTIGRGELAAFVNCHDTWFLIRTVDMPLSSLPLPNYKVIAARGPFTVESEYSLMKRHKIDVLVCKASGGDMTKAKLEAARAMGCPVVMIARPNPLDGPRAHSVDAVVSWLSEVLT